MQTIKIKNNQCFIDVVLEATGSLSNTLLMAIENNTSITDEKALGSDYKVVGQVNKMIVDKLRVNPPATGLIDYKSVFNYRLPHTFPMF